MKRTYITQLILIAVIGMLTSCLGDDDTQSYYLTSNHTAITGFSLSAANQYCHTIGSQGQDSIYKKAVAVSDYTFYIDHEKGLIYNPDSLPYGTDPEHILINVTTANSATVYLQNIEDKESNYHATTDSVDFSTPRIFHILSQSGIFYRNYTVQVNIHQEQGDTLIWSHLTDNNVFADFQGMKAVAANGYVYLFGTDGTQTKVYRTSDTDGKNWDDTSITLSADAYKSVVKQEDNIFVLSGQQLLKITEGVTETVTTLSDLKQLIGASTTHLFAVATNGNIMQSQDGGVTWITDNLDESQSLLPVDAISYTYMPIKSNDSIDLVVVTGLRSADEYPADTTAVVWTKIVEYTKRHRDYPWTYVDIADDNNWALPRLANLTIMQYDGGLLAFGGNGIGACTIPAFNSFYYSKDGGITWTIPDYTFPATLVGGNVFAATVDSNNYIWIVSNGAVWRGRINRLGWKDEQKVFFE